MKGLRVTGGYFLSKQVTLHYPRESLNNLESFRGPLELAPDLKNPGEPLCIACLTCASSCPTGAISVVKKKAPKAQKKDGDETRPKPKAPKGPAKFTYDYTLCCQCGLCAENCPKKALRFSGNPYSAATNRNDFHFDLLEKVHGLQLTVDSGPSPEPKTQNRKPKTQNPKQ